MKYYLVAGEKSGDLHAANLMKAIKKEDHKAEFRFWGGDDMKEVGGTMVKHYREFAVMGFGEIVKKLPSLWKLLGECEKDILAYQPDATIFVDFSGFNLRVAKRVHPKGVKTFYYISPKVWAWNQKRALGIKKVIDHMFVILNFEKEFYQRYGYEVDYVGNPIFDAISSFEPNPNFLRENLLQEDRPILALLPGSRAQEVVKILPTMVEAAQKFPTHQVVVAGVDNLPQSFYDVATQAGVPVINNATYDLLSNAACAIVTSGTATLETALFRVPQVVAYKTSTFTYFMGKMLLKIPYISLVNLVANKLLAEELIQKDCTAPKIAQALQKAIDNTSIIKSHYDALYENVRTEGASKRTAGLIMKYLSQYATAFRPPHL